MNFLGMIPLRWWLYVGAAAALAGVLWHDHHQTHRANSLAATITSMRAQHEADLETARLNERAHISAQVHHDEDLQIRTVTDADPLHGGLCDRPAPVRRAATGIPGDAGPSAAARDFLALPERDHSSDEGQPDQLGMLDLLAKRADLLSAQLREWQGR
jgi:hypothetical protein